MLKPQCNHDRKNWVMRTGKRKRVNDGVQNPSVPPKVPPLETCHNFSQSRKTQENNYQKNAEKSVADVESKFNATTLPASATIKNQTTNATNRNQTTGVQFSTPNISSKVTSHFNFSSTAVASNIQAISPKDAPQLNLSTPTAATAINNQNVTPSINSQLNLNTSSCATSKSSRYFRMLSTIGAFSKPAAAAVAGTSTLKQSSEPSNLSGSAVKAVDENMVPKNDCLPKPPTVKKSLVDADEVIFLTERKSKSAKGSFVSATKTTSKAKKKPTLAANNVTKPKDIEWIILSDTDDEMSNDAIVAKVPAKIGDSSADFSNNSAFNNDIKTETTEASSNTTSTTESSFTDDTFVQILNAALSFSSSSVQESTAISPMKVHDQNIASNEKSAEAVPKSDSTLQNNNYDGILEKPQISSKITPAPKKTNERADHLLSWITNISYCSMKSLLGSENDDIFIVEPPRETAATSPASATIKDQITDAQFSTPNVSSKVASGCKLSSTAATFNIQNITPKDTSQLNLSTSTAVTTINNQKFTPSINPQHNLNTSSSSASINNQGTCLRYSKPKATAKVISQQDSKSSSYSAMIDNHIVQSNVNFQLNLNIPSSSASINNQASGAKSSNRKASAKVTSQLNLAPSLASAKAPVADNQMVPPKVNELTISLVDTTINSKNGSSNVKSGLNLASSSTAVAKYIEMVSQYVAPKFNMTTSSDDTTRNNQNDTSTINRQLNISSTSVISQTDDVTNAAPKVKMDTETVSQDVASQLNPTTSSTDAIRPEIESSRFSNSASGTSKVQNNPGINQSTDNDRTVTHYKKSQTEPKETEMHELKDSLTYFVAQKPHDNEILRGPEILDNLANIDVSKSFTVLSYNVLSQTKIEKNRKLYSLIKEMPQIFQWNYRWKLLSIELDRFHADICCLQEVEKDRVEKYYHPKMVGIKNYKSFYAWNKEGKISDGCAIYWNSEKFEKIEEHVIPLNYEVSNLNKANVAQILHLKHRITGIEVLVVNTQLISDPKSGIQKLYQLSIIFAHLHKIRTNNQSIIFCGDFGFVPYSYLYNFVTDGALDFSKQRITSIDGRSRGGPPIESILFPAETKISNNCTFIDKVGEASNKSTIVSHSFKIEAVYGKMAYSEKNILSTFYHNTKQKKKADNLIGGKPDYIFYSIKEKINVRVRNHRHDVVERDLFLHQRLSLPDKESLDDLVKCTPHRITGSDHLPLFAEFFFA